MQDDLHDDLDADPAPTQPRFDGPPYCPRCGMPEGAGNHTVCRTALTLEPPRYCASCRRRMVVQVTPGDWTARCSEHGELTRSTWAPA
jgi:hypothetical protein